MTRPLLLDLLRFLFPQFTGIVLFVVGCSVLRWSRTIRFGLVSLAVGVVAVGALSLARLLPLTESRVLSDLGGPTVWLSWSSLFLFGVVWNAPGRSLSSGFLATLVTVSGCLLLIETSGPLWWRICAAPLWQRFADAEGKLQQTSAVTCSPTAAVMLLHRYGISASEGEMAYLAGTSLFGTDAHSMARGLDNKLYPHSLQAEVRLMDYESCIREGRPFLAHVRGPSLGHALLVTHVDVQRVTVLDPVDGTSKVFSRADFEQLWDGTAILVVQG